MKIIKYTYIDIHYNENEMEQSYKEKKRLERLGYSLEVTDLCTTHDYCDQYLRYSKSVNK